MERVAPVPPGARLATGPSRRPAAERQLTMARLPLHDPETPTPYQRQVRLRLMLLALSACLWAGIIVVRLVQLQVLDVQKYELQAARQSERTINLDPRRGPILDRHGRQLAVSVDVESIYAVPTDIDDPVRAAAALAKALDLDAAARRTLQAQLQRTRAFVWVRRKVDAATAQAVRDLQLEGVGFVTENRRYYPQRELASQVIGYVGLDNTGMSGIEYAFEDDIKGRAAKMVIRTDARRRPLGHIDKPSTDGHTVVLTLDESIQHVAERELERAVAETGSVAGMAIVMEPAHRRDPRPRQPPDLQPQPLPGLPERALAQPRGVRLLRAGEHLQDLHRRRRPAGARRGPRRGDRLRPGVRGDRGRSASTTTTSSTSSASAR